MLLLQSECAGQGCVKKETQTEAEIRSVRDSGSKYCDSINSTVGSAVQVFSVCFVYYVLSSSLTLCLHKNVIM